MNEPYKTDLSGRMKRVEARIETLRTYKERLEATADTNPPPMGKRLHDLLADDAAIDEKLNRTESVLRHLLALITEHSVGNAIAEGSDRQEIGDKHIGRKQKNAEPI